MITSGNVIVHFGASFLDYVGACMTDPLSEFQKVMLGLPLLLN
jgi:hypothetical protein